LIEDYPQQAAGNALAVAVHGKREYAEKEQKIIS